MPVGEESSSQLQCKLVYTNNMALNPRQMKFVEGYLSGKPASQAYIEAGYDAKGNAAESAAARMLRNVQVQSAIETARETAVANQALTVEWVLSRLKLEATRTGEGASHSARVRAAELLGKTLKLFPDQHELSGPAGAPIPVSVTVYIPANGRNDEGHANG